jgi:hypothetical protein
MSKLCPQCSKELAYKSGFNKIKNKPWQGYFCPDKACGFVEWLSAGVATPQPTQTPSFDEKQYQTQPTVLENILETLINIQKLEQEMYKIHKELLNKQNNGEKSSGNGEGEAVAGNG